MTLTMTYDLTTRPQARERAGDLGVRDADLRCGRGCTFGVRATQTSVTRSQELAAEWQSKNDPNRSQFPRTGRSWDEIYYRL